MACARCAAENASLTQMSPSFASSATKAGSFFSSSLWKRVFSRQRMSPSFMAATDVAAASPMQSSAKATGLLMTFDSASATGLSESLASRPFGRPKCASRITLPPFPEISVMVGATRSSRVASVTRPFSMGTLRSTRSSTRLPFTSTSSRVRKVLDMVTLLSRAHCGAKCRCAEPGPTLEWVPALRRVTSCRAASGTRDLRYSSFPIATAVSAMRLEKPHSLSYQDITRTSVPFCTLVWSSWNVDECGSWLKSIETFGADV